MAGKKVADFLGKLGIKAPWAYTGPLSSPEYMNHLPKAINYRGISPISQPVRPAVPQAEADKVYNIKYYTRDTRREVLPGGTKKLEQYGYEVKAKDEALEAAVVPPTPAAQYKWSKFRPILDQENNGYTL